MGFPKPGEAGEGGDRFPTEQLIVLAICRLAEPIAFTSIMAYTYAMVKDFQGGDDTSASFYAGLLVSVFAVAEACTAILWGMISDRYGRKPIILIGLSGTAASSLMFGFATNIWVALAARLIGGLLNGNVAVMQTMVAELCTKAEYEAKAYAMPPLVWSVGNIVGVAMGGYLAQPARYYPSTFSPDGLFGRYPYLLPNIVIAAFVLVAITQGSLFLIETNPRHHSPSQPERQDNINFVDERTPLQPRERTPVKAFTRPVILWIIAAMIMAYHQMAAASLLPVYLLDSPRTVHPLDLYGGLGYTIHDVGSFISLTGFLSLLLQAVIFPVFVSAIGPHHALLAATLLCPLAYLLTPFLPLLPRSSLRLGVYTILLLQRLCTIIIYPCCLIGLKDATPSSSVLGKVNGLAISASSAARTFAPPLSGIIYSVAGSAVAWWSVAAVAVLGIVELCCCVSRPKARSHDIIGGDAGSRPSMASSVNRASR